MLAREHVPKKRFSISQQSRPWETSDDGDDAEEDEHIVSAQWDVRRQPSISGPSENGPEWGTYHGRLWDWEQVGLGEKMSVIRPIRIVDV